jgi:transcriptional regulator with XRE-family HTH domain
MNEYFDALLVGSRLTEERVRLGLSKVGLADACGVRREMIARYEKGEAAPGAEVLAKLMMLGGDVAYILTGIHSASAQAISDQRGVYVSDPRKLALLDNYEHSTEEGKRTIDRVALLATETQHREVKGRKLKKAG